MRQLRITYLRRMTEGVNYWQRVIVNVGDIPPFEALSMAAGLRAESKNIRDVQVEELLQVAKTIG